jgi:hypothetical protein
MTPFERMLDSTLYVAGDRARREGRPMAVLQHEQGQPWTCGPADRPNPPGYHLVTVIAPHEHTEEFRMGLAKRIYTARCQGQHVEAGVLRALDGGGATRPRAPRPEGDLAEAMISHALATQGQGLTADLVVVDEWADGPAIPAEVQAPDDAADRPARACTICGGDAPPCISLCARALDPPLHYGRREPAPARIGKDRWADSIIGVPGSRIEIVDGKSTIVPPEAPGPAVTPPGMPRDMPAPPAGPYRPPAAANRPRRKPRPVPPGQGSLFD